ncbi:MerR family DNA-binding transcriptional regulator [Defluviimonas sp. WL0050]|uniref:MerR family DNA-binding transcriptional regulator n=1 Tax=Albidovulum litorale TaxID=2984134 RepID=A0ABT2ZJE4_9RHOB|nr:MerR family DNA-binding transcriptional regulator [Defluviimonas sp. WL0050]MCV2871247.1 MerR family DNA-binding transcriptional regulator [Defluviimonas sp. WL0050]
MSNETMTIREMCDAFDVTPRTLRFYESKELLYPIREGQKRLYTKKDRGRLTLILRGKRFGFSLEEIRQLLDLYDPQSLNMAQVAKTLDVAKHHLADMTQRRDELNVAIAELEAHIELGEKHLVNPKPIKI